MCQVLSRRGGRAVSDVVRNGVEKVLFRLAAVYPVLLIAELFLREVKTRFLNLILNRFLEIL